jgi:hypothetical protein
MTHVEVALGEQIAGGDSEEEGEGAAVNHGAFGGFERDGLQRSVYFEPCRKGSYLIVSFDRGEAAFDRAEMLN